jgi:hypothetical protein
MLHGWWAMAGRGWREARREGAAQHRAGFAGAWRVTGPPAFHVWSPDGQGTMLLLGGHGRGQVFRSQNSEILEIRRGECPEKCFWEVHVKVSPMWLDACVCMRNADTGAGVPRGATVRTECNWAKSSHAGAQPASFVVIVCLSLSLSLSVAFGSLLFSLHFVCCTSLLQVCPPCGGGVWPGPRARAQRRYTWESESVQRHFIPLVFRRHGVTAGAATAHNGPGSIPGGRGLLVARPGGAGRPRTSGRPANYHSVSVWMLCGCSLFESKR